MRRTGPSGGENRQPRGGTPREPARGVVQGALPGDSETTLATAWRESSKQAVAASIMGWIRQAALGDAPTPVAPAHRQPNEGDHDRGSRSARRRPAVLQAGRRRLAAPQPDVRRRTGWGAAAVPAGDVGGVSWPLCPRKLA